MQVLYYDSHYDGNTLRLTRIYRYSGAQTLKLYCDKGRRSGSGFIASHRQEGLIGRFGFVLTRLSLIPVPRIQAACGSFDINPDVYSSLDSSRLLRARGRSELLEQCRFH